MLFIIQQDLQNQKTVLQIILIMSCPGALNYECVEQNMVDTW